MGFNRSEFLPAVPATMPPQSHSASHTGCQVLQRCNSASSGAHCHNVKAKIEELQSGLTASVSVQTACDRSDLIFSLLVITVSFLPVFTLEAQEGVCFRRCAEAAIR
jgi:Cu/Ag efflux pump CusA